MDFNVIMRFENIHDFISLMDKCPFCNNKLELSLNSRNIINQDPLTKLYCITYPEEPSRYSFEHELYHVGYFSRLKEDELSCWSCYDPEEHKVKVFSVNIYNNQLTTYGLTKNIQKIILEYDMFLLKKCDNRDCLRSGFKYRYQSSNLVLGTLTRRIYPLVISAEAVTVIIDSKKFSLISSIDSPNTYLLDSKNTIATLPKLDLYKMLDKDYLIKKIKTYVLFS